ncbi:Stp1/IreP family PP2C-type Ser/Thr phosphatase [Apilactobacillus apisilvae]|uniref:Stp1/IreP family PP2C-type Ser/Thr phosphatase n=1 Tax=Apilactobacillus apisilvae TaxID=2923364 RepID=A0ABY4PIN9_9LACO|nr:Stp1/IreP family PP2C-type Ser/Thr phosphatase [Apilactobacillus apisilvae]UQS85326.1 Stp1/IreP family PP2C-type Ser/Thr phosphatase [Apilactobacillus apisilvae]
MKIASKSSIGRVRINNEDYVGVFYNQQGAFITILADGIGGNRGGEVASKMAVDILGEKFKEFNIISIHEIENWLLKQLKIVNDKILQTSETKKELEKMGTTIVVAVFFGNQYLVTHLGDSRCYLIHSNKMRQITEDHSYVNALVQKGELSREDADMSPLKNIIIKGLGVSADADAAITKFKLMDNDIILLCSDGLTNMVDNVDIADELKRNLPVEKVAQNLINLANHNGGKDNISVIIVKNSLGSDSQ